MTIKLNYYTPGFDGQMFAIQVIDTADLPALAAYWDSASCANVRSWEIV